MNSYPALRSPVLILALLPGLLGELSCSRDPSGIISALPPSNVSAAAEQASAELADRGLAAVQRQIAQREYWASDNGEGLQAPNRVHNLRIYFEPTGIHVHDRTRTASPELLALSPMGIGRGETLARLEPGKVSSEGARVEIKRPGLIEWYENSPTGLEQGFTLNERPAGVGLLWLELAVAGGEATIDDDSVIFQTATGRRLRYSKLVATDANGRLLLARMKVPAQDRLELWVDESTATYPLTIDPILTAVADAQLEANQEGALLGFSVSGAGDVNGDGFADVIVGAGLYDAGQMDEGAAFVFLGSAAGIADGNPSTAHAQLESNQARARVGRSVSGAGDVNGDGFADVIVGAPYYDAGETDEGAAFVFLGSAAGIADGNPSTAHAQIESNQADAELGLSVSGAGDVNDDGFADVIVGAVLYDAGESAEGAAFVFLGSAAGIADGDPSTAHAQLESNQDSARLGFSVSGAGDVNDDGFADVIVGAIIYYAGEGSEGAAFMFLGSATGIADGGPSTAHAQLESNQADARLGWSVSGAGDVNGDGFADVIVGAHYYDADEIGEGAAFVFLGSAAGIADGNPSTAHAQLESNQAGARLGNAVSGAGDVNGDGFADVIVGALHYDAGEIGEGAAFVFLPEPSATASLLSGVALLSWLHWRHRSPM
jgi:hypothetical protein